MTRPRKSPSVKGISRIDDASQIGDGWYVRLKRGAEKFSKFFKDSDYASKEAAFSAARRYYYSLVRDHPMPSRKKMAGFKTSRNTSGIVGVRRVIKSRKGHDYEFWEAAWCPKRGVKKIQVFSIDKYGAKEAKRLAIEAREKGVSEMRDR